MSERFIYSSTGAVRYRVSDQGGSVFIYDAQGTLRYRYDRSSDTTYDAAGFVFMHGSILPDLT